MSLVGVLQEFLNANNPQRADASSDLNSLANGGSVTCTNVLSNVQADGKGQGFPEVKAKLSLAALTPVAPAAVYGWLICADDGSNYETTVTSSTTVPPLARPPDFIWSIGVATSTAQIVDAWATQGAPICATMKLVVWNVAGVALASSGNSVNLYFNTDEINSAVN